MIRLYDYLPSGNGYKVRLLLHQLDIPYERVEVDILAGESRSDHFLSLNPNGRVPLVVLEDGRILSESNAILCYFAEGTAFLPEDRYQRALALQWLFFEQYSHEPYIAVSRFWLQHMPPELVDPKALAQKQEGGYAALEVMERRLGKLPFLLGHDYTVADIALYAYTHVADEGGFDLSGYPAIKAWLARVAAQPKHIPITQG